jgi:hypothetical protein
MGRLLVLSLAITSLAASTAQSAPAQHTALTISYWENGSTSSEKTAWTLTCDPAGGTLRRPQRACERLASGGRQLFAQVKAGQICTQIYGGPQVALVTGTLDGRRLWARFQRRNGCEIARWNRLSPWLLPAAGVT